VARSAEAVNPEFPGNFGKNRLLVPEQSNVPTGRDIWNREQQAAIAAMSSFAVTERHERSPCAIAWIANGEREARSASLFSIREI
jgi:hypothetical protein